MEAGVSAGVAVRLALALGCALLGVAGAQTPLATQSREEAPLPAIPALMRQVEINQRNAEAVEKDYLYHSVEVRQEFDSHQQLKKTTTMEYDHFWLDGAPVVRLVKKDGRPLTPQETAKEDQRLEKEAAKARERREKADAAGKETDPDGNEEITVSRLLALGAFTNPRRVDLNGRPVIAFDFTGDPHARTQNRAEDAVRDLAGTAWIDEQDQVLARVEGHFVNNFKIAGGLLADIRKDTQFTFEQRKINDEVWLPARVDAQGSARALLFFSFSGAIHVTDSDYRKFRTTSTILPPSAAAEPARVPDTVPGELRR